ncbi:DEP domain-containing protein 1B-like isoform X4 [Artemia franciscana]|uniref:DEP domain-containing protein 1B-like isoform X3 n=1 Tax=Artemia franciscana TaxID=6661 RepID=UPI0032D9DC23
MDEQPGFNGPYRATRLWNEAIRTFRNGMPVSRHWRQFRSYDACFGASEAVDWLHTQLRENPHFGPSVTKQQTIQLLQKFYKAGVFENVKVSEKEEFKEGMSLYRFSNKSPFKNLRTPGRVPLAPLNNQIQTSPQFRPPKNVRPQNLKDRLVEPENLRVKHKTVLEASQLAELWKKSIVERLEELTNSSTYGIPWLKHEEISPLWVLYNVTCIGPRGVVRPPDCDESPPKWVLYGMKALTNWPNYEIPLMPNYEGSEIDVFKVITDYFCTCDEPLILPQLYKAFIASFNYIEVLERSMKHSRPLYQSVEDLLAKMSSSSSFGLHSTPVDYENLPNYVTLPRKCRKSSSSPEIGKSDLSSICFETVFASEVPQTRIVPKTMLNTWRGNSQSSVFSNEYGTRMFSSVRSPMAEENFVPLDPNRVSSEGFKREKSKNFFRRSGRRKSDRDKANAVNAACQNTSGGYINLGAYDSPVESSTRDYVNIQQATNWAVQGCRGTSSQSLYSVENMSEMQSRPCTSTGIISDKLRDHRENSVPINTHPGNGWKTHAPYEALSDQLRHLFASTFSLNLSNDRHNEGSSLSNCSAAPSSLGHSSRATIVSTDSVLQPKASASSDPVVMRIDFFRLLTLLLPPSDRRKLHLLLRFMSKVATNRNLVLVGEKQNKDFMVETFYRCILCTASEPDYDELNAQRIVAFLMEHVEAVMTVPPEVCATVQQKILDYQKSQQVSPGTYESQREQKLNDALSQLLDQIVNDQKLNPKDKKKKLKQFREAHPAIYSEHFPNGEDAVFLSPKKTEKKLLKLRSKNFRI